MGEWREEGDVEGQGRDGLGGGPEVHAGWKVVGEAVAKGRMGAHCEGGQSPPVAVASRKKKNIGMLVAPVNVMHAYLAHWLMA